MNYISGFYGQGSQWQRYGIGVLAVAIALLLKLLLVTLVEIADDY